MPIPILLADDQPVVRLGFHHLANQFQWNIVAETDSADQIIPLCQQLEPVLITETRINQVDVIKLLEDFAGELSPVGILFFSNDSKPTTILRASNLDCCDYLLKTASLEQLVDAIRNAAHECCIPEDSLLRTVKRRALSISKWKDIDTPLTQREQQVLQHVAMGLSNREVGKSLGISTQTVKEHVQHILRKLGANDRTQAAVWAVKMGLI